MILKNKYVSDVLNTNLVTSQWYGCNFYSTETQSRYSMTLVTSLRDMAKPQMAARTLEFARPIDRKAIRNYNLDEWFIRRSAWGNHILTFTESKIDSEFKWLKSNRKAMKRNWSNQKANPALKTKAGN